MKNLRKIPKRIPLLFCLLAATGTLLACSFSEKNGQDPPQTKNKIKTGQNQTPIKVTDISFTRISGQELQISWSDSLNPYVIEYELLRKEPKNSDWTTVQTLRSDGEELGRTLAVTDSLPSDVQQQYLYRVDVTVTKPSEYRDEPGQEIPATNLLVCIDPGHFAGHNKVTSDNLSYAEGDFTLELATELEKTLKTNYGISSILTRDTGTITIDGYTDQALDSAHISLRGEMSEDCDLFVSLHTNANLENAGGSPTDRQPIAINKPIVFVNSVAFQSPEFIVMANEIGQHLAAVSFDRGLSTVRDFRKANRKEDVLEWTDAYNDQRDVEGTVCKRTGTNGDYYGVLRGATNVNVPGLIVEHGFHTVPEVRNAAVEEDLKTSWSEADACGIAAGFGLTAD